MIDHPKGIFIELEAAIYGDIGWNETGLCFRAHVIQWVLL